VGYLVRFARSKVEPMNQVQQKEYMTKTKKRKEMDTLEVLMSDTTNKSGLLTELREHYNFAQDFDVLTSLSAGQIRVGNN